MFVSIYVCICMYVFVYVCIYVPMYVYMYAGMLVFYICLYICECEYTYVFTYVSVYVHTYALCAHVRVYTYKGGKSKCVFFVEFFLHNLPIQKRNVTMFIHCAGDSLRIMLLHTRSNSLIRLNTKYQ